MTATYKVLFAISNMNNLNNKNKIAEHETPFAAEEYIRCVLVGRVFRTVTKKKPTRCGFRRLLVSVSSSNI